MPLLLRCPTALSDALSREMDYNVEPRQIPFDLARLGVPANVSFGTRRARQTVDPVPPRLQLRDQSRPDEPLGPAYENVHVTPPNAEISNEHMVTTATLQNRMSSPMCPHAPLADEVGKADTSPNILSRAHLLDEPTLICVTIRLDGVRMLHRCMTDEATA